jgi:hypothetical protein
MFLREINTRAQHELDELAAFIPILANEMYEVYNDTHLAYPNRRWQGCFDCNYTDLCTAQSRGETANFDAIRMSSYTTRPVEVESLVEEEPAA